MKNKNMNFEEFQALKEKMELKLSGVSNRINSLNTVLEKSRQDLSNVDPNSREAFSIEGEIEKLKASLADSKKQYMAIIDTESQKMKSEIKKIRTSIIKKQEAIFKESYEPIRGLIDQICEYIDRYRVSERDFKEKLNDDIMQFRKYDDRKLPSISNMGYDYFLYDFVSFLEAEYGRLTRY